MHYKNSDIIMCFPGIGRTFFASLITPAQRVEPGPDQLRKKTTNEAIPHSDFTLDKDFSGDDLKGFAEEVASIHKTGRYRYILIPMRYDLAKHLYDSDIQFIVVKPYELDRDVWMKRWMKAGESALDLSVRLKEMNNSESGYAAFAPIVHLSADEWLGNILDQTPIKVPDIDVTAPFFQETEAGKFRLIDPMLDYSARGGAK